MNKKPVITIVLAVIFIFVIVAAVRSFLLKPSDKSEVTAIPEGEYDPAVWGRYYPLQYGSFQKNTEMSASPTDFGGSVKYQHSLRQPEILVNFKGMAFSKDYTEDRGHPHALTDLKESKRITLQSPGACMTCKSAHLIGIFKSSGWAYAKKPLGELFVKMKHSIACANCHNPSTMELRVANPAFIEAMQRKGIDVTKAAREDMRSYVCGQCHAEYYFEPETSRVIFPWDKGAHPEQMYAYYSGRPGGFEGDWIHPDSQTMMLKAQHPDFETFSGGTHAKAGISCADCHMPYMRERGQKYTSHWVTSPMKHTEASCRRCHPEEAKWLLDRVKATQKSVWQLQHTAGMTISGAHETIAKALAVSGVNKEELDKARENLRKAQWYWDFVAAENSMGFHNPALCLNILGQSIDLAHKARESALKAAGVSP
ncbi:MAG: ammonia-forming cytochrome c nitrite reductase subunit c552 [Syntrophorhabdaceae bacterium]|nr:ammonia-forming cytochrome c nitrite reductase subunit c552 [Syntrophorhabdaceae bacterium]